MAVRRRGSGPDVVLFHGGMGSWGHWIRFIDALATRFTVHALDHPSYGDLATVARETMGPAYLDLVHGLFAEMFPGDAASPGRLLVRRRIAASLAPRLGPRVTHLCLVSPEPRKC
jgi:pimeloyl-ACP methyl ester carboxylesterase